MVKRVKSKFSLGELVIYKGYDCLNSKAKDWFFKIESIDSITPQGYIYTLRPIDSNRPSFVVRSSELSKIPSQQHKMLRLLFEK